MLLLTLSLIHNPLFVITAKYLSSDVYVFFNSKMIKNKISKLMKYQFYYDIISVILNENITYDICISLIYITYDHFLLKYNHI